MKGQRNIIDAFCVHAVKVWDVNVWWTLVSGKLYDCLGGIGGEFGSGDLCVSRSK